MASFQAKTGWKRLKKRENKNYRFVSFLPDAYEIIKKKVKKLWQKKIKKTPLWLLFKPKYVGKGGEREKTKIVFPFRSYSTENIKFQKKRKRIKKIKKYHCGFVSCQNRLENAEKEK